MVHKVEMDSQDYHLSSELSHSQLKQIEKSPWEFWKKYIDPARPPPPEYTNAQLLGERVHYATLQPELFRRMFKRGPDVSAATKAWKEYCAAFPEFEVLKPDAYDDITNAAIAVREHPVAAKLLNDPMCEFEQSIFFDYEEVKCRARIDAWIPKTCIIDLKTADVEPHAFQRQCALNWYHTQAAFYQQAIYALTGQRLQFIFIAVQPKWPYKVVVYQCSQEFMMHGRARCIDWIAKYQDCVETNEWPSYTEDPILLDLPSWRVYEHE